MSSHVQYRIENSVAEIVLQREPVNAIDMALSQELNASLRRARDDTQARAVIITSGCERAFSAGMDLKQMRGASGLELRRFLESLYMEMHDLQYRLGKPTVAAVNGTARAAGVTIAVSCDVVIMAEDCTLAYPEINVGVIPAMHFVHLPRQIGRHRAFELLFTGEPVSAREAAAAGLINRAVPRDQVLAEARRVAATFAAKSPTVMKLARDAFMRANDFEYRRNIESMVDAICNIIETDDAQEGLDAFNEKRAPKW